MLLTGVVMFTGVLISWGIDDRPREFFAFLFILATGVFGVFVALDLFMLFFFYEIAVFPMYLLIAIWGWKVTREYAAMKLTLYLFIGSVIALVGALGNVFRRPGSDTFDMLALEQAGFSADFQILVPLRVSSALQSWAVFSRSTTGRPDGHVAAPTAVSMFHAGVLDETGRVRCAAGWDHAAARRSQVLGMPLDHVADTGQCGLRRLHCFGANRF